MGGNAFLVSSPHGVHKVCQCLLLEIEPFLLQQVKQLLNICRRGMILQDGDGSPGASDKEAPEVLNGL